MVFVSLPCHQAPSSIANAQRDGHRVVVVWVSSVSARLVLLNLTVGCGLGIRHRDRMAALGWERRRPHSSAGPW